MKKKLKAFVTFGDVDKADLPKMEVFWFLKNELHRAGGFSRLSEILSKHLKVITKPTLGFELIYDLNKCFLFDDDRM